MDKKHRNLFRLHELSDYKVASHYPDVRGWKVIDADNRKIGEVDELLVNKATERVVYLDVEVDKKLIEEGHEPYSTSVSEGTHEMLNKDGENHIIIPIGAVSIDEHHKHLISHDINYDTFRRTKRYSKNQEFDRNMEVQIINIYYPNDNVNTTNGNSNNDDDNRFYERSQFNRRD
jgi:sporulation protein YlmC with PRC-barrel domain